MAGMLTYRSCVELCRFAGGKDGGVFACGFHHGDGAAAERFYRGEEGVSLRDAGSAAGIAETVVRGEEVGAVVLRGEPGLWGRLTVVEKIGRSGKDFGGGLAAANECW